jgi:hypothetical protein
MLSRRDLTKADDLALAKADVVSGMGVDAALYGTSFSLYCLCARSLFRQLKDPNHRKQNIGTLVLMTMVMTCGIIVLALDLELIMIQYIEHGHFPWSKGGPYFLDNPDLYTIPFNRADNAFTILLECLTSGVLVGGQFIFH